LKRAQTDNTDIDSKIFFREKFVSQRDAVLNLFSGEDRIWGDISKRVKISVLNIDKKSYKCVDLVGDNMKFLPSIDIHKYDIIDLDSYGIPYKQLKNVLDREYKGTIFITYIQSFVGVLPHSMLIDLGYTKQMIKKIPTLFYKNGFKKLKWFLSLYKIQKMCYYNIGSKYYIKIKAE
jgi:hypothetical protein